MNEPVTSADNRRAPRMRTLKGARVVLPNNTSTFECTVRNLSDTGALLQMISTLGIPNRFSLLMDDGRSSECEVAWRTDTRIGVRFAKA